MTIDPECEVTVVDAAGKRWTMKLRARSLYHAVIAYNAEQVCGSHREHPKLEPGVRVEVRLGDGRVFHTTSDQAFRWANRETEKDNARLAQRDRM